MSTEDTLGVAALARILTELGQDEAPNVAALVAKTGVSRTTAFEIVRRLTAAGLARRDIDGTVAAGPSAIALGFAAFRIAALAGPAETLLSWLHERGDAFVELIAGETVLVTFGKRQSDTALVAPIRDGDGDGETRAHLRMAWRVHTGQGERQRISADFERVRISLELYLANEETVV